MYQTILIPIDLAHAEVSSDMIRAASKLGKDGARLILLNVIEDIPAYVAAELPRSMLADTQENARKDLKGIARSEHISADIDVRTGHPATAILSAVVDQGADIAIIASHRPGLQDYLLGSTAARVVRHAKCSVLVMR